jgi:hypothetical protein
MEADIPAEPKRLIGKKEDFDFEMWVEVDGKPLEIYAVTEGEGGVPEAWIASEIGKVSSRNARAQFRISRLLAKLIQFARPSSVMLSVRPYIQRQRGMSVRLLLLTAILTDQGR